MQDSKEWNVEIEGQVARTIKAIAHCPLDNDKHPALVELQRLTGRNYGTNLGKWLGWYLEEHLGVRNAIAILQGKAPDVLNDESELIADEDIFACAEYNWCAIERIKNKDDMQKLRMIYSDLESTIQVDSEGPFSFRRLTETDSDDWRFFRGKSISQALFAEDVQLRHLRILKDYGKAMMTLVLPVQTQRSGTVVYAAAICQALVRFDTKITSLSYQDLNESLPGLLERPYIVKSYAELFRTALERCH